MSASAGVLENERAKTDLVMKEREILRAELNASEEKLHHLAVITKNLVRSPN